MSAMITGVPPNGLRNARANGQRPVSAFTKGNRGSWGEADTRAAMMAEHGITVALDARVPVLVARRPWRDLPEAPLREATHDGMVMISGRFKVKSVIAADHGDESAPSACTGCFMIICECGKW